MIVFLCQKLNMTVVFCHWTSIVERMPRFMKLKQLDQLHSDVTSLMGSTVEIIYVQDENPFGLSLENPAMVTKDEKIYILDGLPEEFKIQAVAHELGHLYLKYLGLVQAEYPFDIGYPTSEDYLALELNNALSHQLLIHLLERYDISSKLHLDLRASSLEHIPQRILELRIDDDTTCLHGMGLALYDMEQTLPGFRSDIVELAQMDPTVSHSFDQASEYLPFIVPKLARDQQKMYIESFLKSLGYNPNYFRLRFLS